MTRMAATRDGYGEALLELATNEKIVVLEADLGKSTKSLHFRKNIQIEQFHAELANKTCSSLELVLPRLDIFHSLVHLQFLLSVGLNR